MSTQESTNSSETTKTPQPPADAGSPSLSVPRDPLRELSELLKAEKASQEADPAEKPTEGDKSAVKAKPKTLNELAERLGVDVKDLYDVEVPREVKGVKGDPFKLGQLKDLAAEQDDFTVRSLSLDEDRRRFESEKVRAEAELRELLKALPETALKPEAVRKMKLSMAAKQEKERTRLLEAVPAWNDASVRDTELAGVIEHLKSYGIPDTELIANFDHRYMRLFRDFHLQTQNLRKALDRVTERKTNTPAKSKPANTTQKRQNAAPTTHEARQAREFMQIIESAGGKR